MSQVSPSRPASCRRGPGGAPEHESKLPKLNLERLFGRSTECRLVERAPTVRALAEGECGLRADLLAR